MDDLEINRRLAIAIGWKPKQLGYGVHYIDQCIGIRERLASDSGEVRSFYDEVNGNGWCVVFDYSDWSVIGPIAERYDAFPQFCDTGSGEWWVAGCGRNGFDHGQGADTPQKAIAMAVIAGTTP